MLLKSGQEEAEPFILTSFSTYSLGISTFYHMAKDLCGLNITYRSSNDESSLYF